MTSYNTAVDALKRFRDGHIRIGTLYIVTQARSEAALKGKDVGAAGGGAKGTGGTLLVPFLKAARDNTMRTAVKEVV